MLQPGLSTVNKGSNIGRDGSTMELNWLDIPRSCNTRKLKNKLTVNQTIH